jgi:hypothetical protein
VTSSAERKALNEGRFRVANERLEEAAREIVGADGSLVPFLCECPRMDCTQIVLLTLSEYERVRADGRQGIAVLGHEDLEVERVVEQNERFLMTEKFGRAGDVHNRNDPRQDE